MKLERKWARVATVFLLAAVLLVLAADVMTELMPDFMRAEERTSYQRFLTGLMFGSLASAAGALAVMRRKLCCPHCRALSVNPWQKRGTVRFCSRCGAALAFDDGETK